MPHRAPDLTDTLHRLPVFSLPEFALFPNTLVPFHVFEDRYCSMLDACLTERRLLVVAGQRPGWEHDNVACPPVFDHAGLGRVLSDRRFADGRYNIFVHCISRVEIVDTLAATPFRLVNVRHVPDDAIPRAVVQPAYQRVVALATNLVRDLGPDGAALGKLIASTDDPAVLSNRLAAMIVDDPEERQQLLEMTCPLSRLDRVALYLASELMELGEHLATSAEWVN